MSHCLHKMSSHINLGLLLGSVEERVCAKLNICVRSVKWFENKEHIFVLYNNERTEEQS